MDFDFKQIEIFVTVAKRQSFSKAAKALGLSQPTVSEHIANLEKALGARLFDRLGRRIVLTRVGEHFRRQSARLLDVKREARLELEALMGLTRGDVAIGGSTIPGEYILPGFIVRFREQYAGIRIRVLIGDSETIANRVADGGLELGIIGARMKGLPLVHTGLWKDELVLALPAGHRLEKRKSVTLQDFLKEPFILRESGSGTERRFEQALKAAGMGGIEKLNVAAELGSSNAVKEGVKRGLGVAILSSRAVESEPAAGAIRAVRITGLPLARSFYLIRDRRRTLSPAGRCFMDFLIRHKD